MDATLVCRSFAANAVRLQAPLEQGVRRKRFRDSQSGDARFVTRPAADDKASEWEDSYDASQQ
jgi:hypothetical protein